MRMVVVVVVVILMIVVVVITMIVRMRNCDIEDNAITDFEIVVVVLV